MPFRFDSSGLDTIVCLLHNLSAGKMWSPIFFFFLPTLLLSAPHAYLRLSVFKNQCICRRVYCALRRRDSDYNGFACFLRLALCKWGRTNRFWCLVRNHWFREVMKTHCFYLTGHYCCCMPPSLLLQC